jgi:hypothetical protein
MLENKCIKQITDIKFNKYMLLGFNRFNKLGDKLSDLVNIPAELNLEGEEQRRYQIKFTINYRKRKRKRKT